MRNGNVFDVEKIVVERYAKGTLRKEKSLCSPVSYDPKYLRIIPEEILNKDYGCGDPTRFLKEGDAVLDLGSGAGKVCYVASQIVGRRGRVIGIDFGVEMLTLAKRYQDEISKRIGYRNVEFKRGRIQDLKTDLDRIDQYLSKRPLRSAQDYLRFESVKERMREENPLIRNESIDIIVSNCVLNLVRPQDKGELFREMHRVLKKGGRAAISDIVSDEAVPELLQKDPELWSGCVSGAFQEKEFLLAFEEAGFYGITIEKRDEKPWRTIQGIEFRSMTITAYKGKEGSCWERNQAVIYKGPWKQVEDDDRHILKRGIRTAVCDKTFEIFTKAPYRGEIIPVPPRKEILPSRAKPFDCNRNTERHPRETKGMRYRETAKQTSLCMEGGCC